MGWSMSFTHGHGYWPWQSCLVKDFAYRHYLYPARWSLVATYPAESCDGSEAMDRALRIFLCTGMLLSGLLLFAQEPATIDSEPAVRFEQSPGYYHYVAFCRTPKAFTAQIPKSGLPLDAIEFGLGWYVKASVARSAGATSGASPEVEGRIVVSPQ